MKVWLSEYKAISNIGCGGSEFYDNINALVCSLLVTAIEAKDLMSYTEIVLDISKCPMRDSTKSIQAVRQSAKKNFPQTDWSDVEIKLIK